MDPHKREYIAHTGEQQDIAAPMWRILYFFYKFRFADGGMQLLQKEVAALIFFHLGNNIGNVQIITEGKKDFVEITFDQMAS